MQDLTHAEVVDWAVAKYRQLHNKVLRDPDRAIRNLYGQGKLQQISKGVYRFDPNYRPEIEEGEDFDEATKQAVFERDGHACVICGNGPHNGFEIHCDHKIPKSKGGEATLYNGRTLCGPHNMLAKNHGLTTVGKKFFMDLYQTAYALGNQDHLVKFAEAILKVFDEHNMNGHIPWKKLGE